MTEDEKRGGQRLVARLLSLSERTICHWTAVYAPGVVSRRPGRPRHSEEAKSAAMAVVEPELVRQGYSTGAKTIFKGLKRAIPLRLVRDVVKESKRKRRQEHTERMAANRVSIEVVERDVVWCVDGMHLGRDVWRDAITGQVLRDVCTLRLVGVSAGPPVTGEEAIDLVERARRERGCLPLVLMSDNGSGYIDGGFEKYLERNQVIHLRNVPHTPQHNPWAEQAVREIKEDSGLGKGVVLTQLDATRVLAQTHRRLDRARLRPSRGYRTAQECDEETGSWYDRVRREEVYEAVCRALSRQREGVESSHARRKREREVILATLASLGLIRRTRGGEPLPVEKAATIT